MCLDVKNLIGSNLLMWFVDCFYVPDDKEIIKKVQKYLHELGYEHKTIKPDVEYVIDNSKAKYTVGIYDFKDSKRKSYTFNRYFSEFRKDLLTINLKRNEG
jgi:hypothetical protein